MEPIPAESGTDAWHIQVSRAGVPCGLVGIPVRYMHTPVETVCLRDVERAGRLLAEFVCRPAAWSSPRAWKPGMPWRGERSLTMLLQKLSEAHGVSGSEEEVRAILLEADPGPRRRLPHRQHGQPHRLEEGQRRLGPARAGRRAHGRGRTHDHRARRTPGVLRFAKVGGIDDRVLPARVVLIGPKRVPGVIGVKPVHLLERGSGTG